MKFRFKIFKLGNFERPSLNFPAPSSPIRLYLINLKIHYDCRFFFQAILIN